MNTFNRKSLYTALAGLGALGGVGAVDAVNLSPEGLGQVLIYPYYTVRAGANGFAYNTLLSVVNSTPSTKAVKVRFLEGKNSKEVLDFNLFLSPYDVWTATVVDGVAGGKVQTDDTSCILPEQLAVTGQPFVNYAYASDKADDSLDRTREGYVEIIEMATYGSWSSIPEYVSHVGSGAARAPKDCGAVTDQLAANDAWIPLGGLFGAMTLINVFDGSAYSQDATALDHAFNNSDVYANAGDISPTLNEVDPASIVIVNGEAVITDWSNNNRPVDAVSAVLDHYQVLNEFATDPTLLANTDWVVTMPTKNQYVKVGTGNATWPFQKNFDGTKGACDDIAIDFWDREEDKNKTPGGFSPPIPGTTNTLCWEANVITFKATGVLNSKNARFLDVNSKGWINGWAELTFLNDARPLIGGSTTRVSLSTSGASTSSGTASTYFGLPVVGFAVQSYNNNLIVVQGPNGPINVQSTYGADFGHRYKSYNEY